MRYFTANLYDRRYDHHPCAVLSLGPIAGKLTAIVFMQRRHP
ncbi:hypothetical protein [Azospirillum melinis]